MLLGGAIVHHPLDSCPVVPGAIHQHDFSGCRKPFDVALEVPLAALPLARGGQGDDPGGSRIQVLGDALDRAALTGRVPTLENNHHPRSGCGDPLLHAHQFDLKPLEFLLVVAFGEARTRLFLYARHGVFLSLSTNGYLKMIVRAPSRSTRFSANHFTA